MEENRFKEWKPPEMVHGEFTKWKWIPYHPENIKLGKYVDIGALTCLFAHYPIIIEDLCQIGSQCVLYTKNTINGTSGSIVLEKNCSIGSHSVLFPNVRIKANEKIKAGSIVYVDQKGKRHIKEVREYEQR